MQHTIMIVISNSQIKSGPLGCMKRTSLNMKFISFTTILTFVVYICGCNATQQLQLTEPTGAENIKKLSLVELTNKDNIRFEPDTLKSVNLENDTLQVIGQKGSTLEIPIGSINKCYYTSFSYPRTIGAVVMGSLVTVIVAAVSFRLYLDSHDKD